MVAGAHSAPAPRPASPMRRSASGRQDGASPPRPPASHEAHRGGSAAYPLLGAGGMRVLPGALLVLLPALTAGAATYEAEVEVRSEWELFQLAEQGQLSEE